MRTWQALQKKYSSKSSSTPAPNPLASRPFAPQPQAEVIAAPKQTVDQIMAKLRAEHSGWRLSTKTFDPSDVVTPQPLQMKMEIGAPGDKYEEEADRVARQVVTQLRVPKPHPQVIGEPVQRAGMLEDKNELRMKPRISPIQRVELPDEDDELRMKPLVQLQPRLGGMDVNPDLEQLINRERGGGQLLANTIQQPMEQAFGSDFSGVRVHTDGRSDQLNQSIQARAFTIGQDVFFRQGAYQPGNREGQELLAHELTHVVQQNGRVQGKESIGQAKMDLSLLGSVHLQQGENTTREAKVTGDTIEKFGEKTVSSFISTDNIFEADKSALIAATPYSISSDSDFKISRSKSTPILQLQPKDPKDLEKKLDQIEQRYQDMIKDAREDGYNVAADNLERFLKGIGGIKKINVKWLRSFSNVIDAEEVNQERFENSLTKEAEKLEDGKSNSFKDYWDRQLTGSKLTELYYASGTSTIRSTGEFNLIRKSNTITISGQVKHHWFDPYDWHAGLSASIPGSGSVSDSDALLLQTYRGAKSFQMEADWKQFLKGNVIIKDWWFDTEEYSWTGP